VTKSTASSWRPGQDGFYNNRDQFFHKGSTGQWRQVIGDDELPRYATRVAACAPAELAEWIHRPPLPTADNQTTSQT
jgi:hypothetical protein